MVVAQQPLLLDGYQSFTIQVDSVRGGRPGAKPLLHIGLTNAEPVLGWTPYLKPPHRADWRTFNGTYLYPAQEELGSRTCKCSACSKTFLVGHGGG